MDLDKLFRKKLSKAKKDIIDKIIKLQPELEKKKKQLLIELEEPITDKLEDISKEIILDTIIHNNYTYFRDKNNSVFDSEFKLVGVYDKNKILLFEDRNKDKIIDLYL